MSLRMRICSALTNAAWREAKWPTKMDGHSNNGSPRGSRDREREGEGAESREWRVATPKRYIIESNRTRNASLGSLWDLELGAAAAVVAVNAVAVVLLCQVNMISSVIDRSTCSTMPAQQQQHLTG